MTYTSTATLHPENEKKQVEKCELEEKHSENEENKVSRKIY